MTVTEPAPPLVARTAAQALAELLYALAGHCQTHPHLPPVAIRPDSYEPGIDAELHIQTQPHLAAAAIADWADSLADPLVQAHASRGHGLDAVVDAAGRIDATHTVRVWVDVPNIAAALDLPHPHDPLHRVATTAEVVRRFADGQPTGVSGELGTPDFDSDGLVGAPE